MIDSMKLWKYLLHLNHLEFSNSNYQKFKQTPFSPNISQPFILSRKNSSISINVCVYVCLSVCLSVGLLGRYCNLSVAWMYPIKYMNILIDRQLNCRMEFNGITLNAMAIYIKLDTVVLPLLSTLGRSLKSSDSAWPNWGTRLCFGIVPLNIY